jgi:Tol biopolymer transport system component
MLKRFAAAAGVALAVLLAPASSWGTSPGRNGKIVFASGERLHTIAPDGSGLTEVPTTSCEGLEPDWHPNGRTIGFIERCGPSGTFDLSVVDVDGSALSRVYWTFADDAAIDWSPDGSKVLFISDAIGNREIYVSDPSFTDVTNLSNAFYTDDWPAWSPDGSKIAFSSNRTGNFEIYTMNADGTGVTNLTNHPAPDGDGSRRAGGPSWSPDGRKIAFDSARTGQDEIFSMDANGGGVQQLTEGGTNLEPAWSPDGRLIAFASDRTGNRDLFLMASDGTNEVPLMTSPAFDERPDWQVLPLPGSDHDDDKVEDRCNRHHRHRRGGHRRERKCRPMAHSRPRDR